MLIYNLIKYHWTEVCVFCSGTGMIHAAMNDSDSFTNGMKACYLCHGRGIIERCEDNERNCGGPR